MPISELEARLQVPPGGRAQEFYVLNKINRPQPDLNPQTLDLETSTLSETTETDYLIIG